MDIHKALKIKPGSGKVTHISNSINKSYQGAEFIWVNLVDDFGKSAGVWPSNRLS